MFFNKQKNVALPFGRFYHYSGTVVQHIQGSSFVTDIYPEGKSGKSATGRVAPLWEWS